VDGLKGPLLGGLIKEGPVELVGWTRVSQMGGMGLQSGREQTTGAEPETSDALQAMM